MSVHERGGSDFEKREIPVATAVVLSVTVAVTLLDAIYDGVPLALGRDAAAFAPGEWWRLVTPLFVQPDRGWQVAGVFVGFTVVGFVALHDIHGPPLLFGAAAAAVVLWGDG